MRSNDLAMAAAAKRRHRVVVAGQTGKLIYWPIPTELQHPRKEPYRHAFAVVELDGTGERQSFPPHMVSLA